MQLMLDKFIYLLFMRNSNPHSASDIRESLGKFGEITDVYIPTDYHTRKRRNFAYVHFADNECAARAYNEFINQTINACPISIEWAKGDRKSSNDMKKVEYV